MSETTTRPGINGIQVEEIEGSPRGKSRDFVTLLNLFSRLNYACNPSDGIEVFADVLTSSIGYGKIAFYLRRPGTNMLEPYFCSNGNKGMPSLYEGSHFLESLAGRAEPAGMDEFEVMEDGDKHDSAAILAASGFSRVIPMNEGGRLVGAIFLDDRNLLPEIQDGELAEVIYPLGSILIRTLWLHNETERSRMELERFSQVKKRFIGHTSHELRTPLTVVRSAVDSIEGKDSDQELISMAREAIENLQNTVEMLLSYNDIELRKNAFDMVLADISSLVKDCIRELSRDFQENNVSISVDNRAGRVLTILDRSKMKLVFKSLIENALNYVDENGRVEIEMLTTGEEPAESEGMELGRFCAGSGGGYTLQERESKEEHPAPEQNEGKRLYFVCRIGDDGIGIPESEIMHISEPFRMASNSPLNGVKGLGMGLTISQRVIAGHGGRLFCRSGEGTGSIFSIWIPLNSQGMEAGGSDS